MHEPCPKPDLPSWTVRGAKTPPVETPASPFAAKPNRTWTNKFADAFRGIKYGVRGHSSFFVHFFVTVLVITAAVVFECSRTEWCLLLLCIGFVLVTELINSAIETLFQGLDSRSKDRAWRALDIAAGAVLLASMTAAVVGTVIFWQHAVILLGLK